MRKVRTPWPTATRVGYIVSFEEACRRYPGISARRFCAVADVPYSTFARWWVHWQREGNQARPLLQPGPPTQRPGLRHPHEVRSPTPAPPGPPVSHVLKHYNALSSGARPHSCRGVPHTALVGVADQATGRRCGETLATTSPRALATRMRRSLGRM